MNTNKNENNTHQLYEVRAICVNTGNFGIVAFTNVNLLFSNFFWATRQENLSSGGRGGGDAEMKSNTCVISLYFLTIFD